MGGYSSSAEISPKRGRPRGHSRHGVADRILQETEQLLLSHTHYDLTEQMIADKAGVNKAMIHYYFRSKDGLLFELIKNHSDRWSDSLALFESLENVQEETITYDIVKCVVNIYLSKPWITGILLSEFSRSESTIRNLYMENGGTAVLGRLARIIKSLIKKGIYYPDNDPKFVASSILFLAISPPMLAQFSNNSGVVLNEYKSDEWVRYLATLFDAQLRKS